MLTNIDLTLPAWSYRMVPWHFPQSWSSAFKGSQSNCDPSWERDHLLVALPTKAFASSPNFDLPRFQWRTHVRKLTNGRGLSSPWNILWVSFSRLNTYLQSCSFEIEPGPLYEVNLRVFTIAYHSLKMQLRSWSLLSKKINTGGFQKCKVHCCNLKGFKVTSL